MRCLTRGAILFRRVEKRGVARPKLALTSLQPSGEAAARHFGVDVRAGAGNEVHARIFCRLDKRLQSKDAFGRVVALLALQECPVDVEDDCVHAQRLDLFKHVAPKRRHRQSYQK